MHGFGQTRTCMGSDGRYGKFRLRDSGIMWPAAYHKIRAP